MNTKGNLSQKFVDDMLATKGWRNRPIVGQFLSVYKAP